MNKLFIPLAIFLIFTLIVVGCSSSPTKTTPAATVPAATTPADTTAPAGTPVATTPVTTKPAVTSPLTTAPPAPTDQKYGGTMRLIQPMAPGAPIGWVAETSGESLRTMQLSLEILLTGQLDGSLTPGLATSYEVNTDPDNPSLTLQLRKGVKFHDGSDFNAQVVKWNLEQTKAGPTMTGSTVYWKSFDVIDDYTIRINFTTWQNRIMTGFGMPSSYMVSRAAFEKNGIEWMRWNMVGTGPFIHKEFQRDVTTKTVRNPSYWDTGKPYLDGVQYLYVADEMTRVALFRSGGAEQLDLAGNGRIANDLKAVGYRIESQLGGTNVLIPDSMNSDSPWSNAKVRQAAEYAIDKEALSRTFGFGYTQAAYQLPSPSTNVYDPDFAGRKYDIAKARQLLAEAGYPNGFKTRLISSGAGNTRDIMVAIQSYLDKVGIQAELEFPEPAKLVQYTMGTWKNALIYQYIFEWPNYNYGLNLWFGVPTAWFQSLKKPEGWKEAMAASLVTTEPDKGMMQKLVGMAFDDAMVIPLSYPAQLSAVTNNVRDTGIYSRIQNYFWNPQNAWLSD